MKKIYWILIFCFYTTISFGQIIHFDTKWNFMIGDNADYKNENYDDTNWKKVIVPSSDKIFSVITIQRSLSSLLFLTSP